MDLDRRDELGGWQKVIGEGGGQRLAGGVVAHPFIEGGADAVDHAAMHLAFHQQRVDHTAAVVDYHVAHEPDLPGFAIDFHLDHVCTIGIRHRRGLVVGGGLEARRQVGRQRKARHPLQRVGDVAERAFEVGALHPHGALGEFQIVRRNLQHRRRRLARLVRHHAGREVHGVAGGDRLAAGIGAQPERRCGRVAGGDMDVAGPHAQRFGRELRQHRGRALALVGRAGEDGDLAGRPDAHRGAFERAAAGAFDIVCQANPEQAALPPRRLAPGRKLGPAGRRQRAPLAFGVVAAVVGHRQAIAGHDLGDVGQLLRRDQIAAAHLVARKPERVGDAVEQALHHVGTLRPAGTAGRGRRHHIGEAGRDFEPQRRQHIGAEEVGGGVLRQREARRRRRAVVVAKMAADRQQPPLRADRGLDLPVLLAFVVGRGKTLAPVLDPFDRAAEQARGGRHGELLRIERVLGAKAAADMGRDHAHLVLGQAKRIDQHALGLVRHLGGVPDREQVLDRVVAREHAARFDRMAAALVDAETLGQAVRGVGERGLHIAVLHHPMGDQIVRAIDPCFGRATLKPRAWIEHGRQRLVVELDQTGSVLGNGAVLRHDERNRLADVAKLPLGEIARIDIKADRRERQGERDAIAGEGGAQVAMAEHRPHARQRARLPCIEAAQPRMCHRAAHEVRVHQIRQFDIVDEASRAAQQSCIFDPADGAADQDSD